MIFELMGGISVAAGVFVALLWSIYQSILARGLLQYTHIAVAILTILGMASISAVSPFLAQILGFALAATATTAATLETRWNRVLPVFQIIFAIVLILGLPFATV
ncbi:hypothetical protein A9Q96_02030 [Rhodobacterales bacterium 52_120_T64]|nr:hypothetical protein A9Q96_02030 [Rhodobacterales bacterium 52_120_T64]